MKIRKEVQWFAEQMEKKLRENDDRESGWNRCSYGFLLKRIKEELEELHNQFGLFGVENGYQPRSKTGRIIDEAADVANFAMMIADNVKKEKEITK